MKIYFIKSILAITLFLSASVAFASTADNMYGYAWSSNIGWISFNCANNTPCTTSTYGVNKNLDGTLTGYAWSSNIGWIQFGGLSGFPSGAGTYAQNAQVVGTELRGWVKALSADGNGWDGWISLTGTGYGATLSTDNFGGYTWGSDVVGWVDFTGVFVSSVPPGNCSIDSIVPSGINDLLISVTLPGSGTFYSLYRDGTYDVDRTKDSTDVLTDYGVPPGTYSYQLVNRSTGAQCGSPVNYTVDPSGATPDGHCPAAIPGAYVNKTCAPGSTYAGDYKAYPSKVTWTCLGSGTSPGNPILCSERIGPGFKEN